MTRSNLLGLAAAQVLAAALILAAPSPAAAFCRTSSCGSAGTGARCTPPQPTDCGVPLFWSKPCVGYSLNKAASKQVPFTTFQKVMSDAFARWTTAACPGGGSPRMEVTELMPADCDKHEYNQNKGNTNLIVFRDETWPYEGSTNTLALTTVTYNLDTGEIYDADMELNSADHHLTTGDTGVDFDLPSIVTHEAGHFLGLAHSTLPDATMFPDYKQGDLSLRTLSPDDVAGICTVYPPGAAVPADCDTTPRHGFSTQCAANQTGTTTSTGGCALGSAPVSGAGLAVGLAALALAAARRRSRARS